MFAYAVFKNANNLRCTQLPAFSAAQRRTHVADLRHSGNYVVSHPRRQESSIFVLSTGKRKGKA
jgi:hypothetical protein